MNEQAAQPQEGELSLEKRVTLLVDAAINEHNELSVGSYGELIHGLVRLVEQQATRAKAEPTVEACLAELRGESQHRGL